MRTTAPVTTTTAPTTTAPTLTATTIAESPVSSPTTPGSDDGIGGGLVIAMLIVALVVGAVLGAGIGYRVGHRRRRASTTSVASAPTPGGDGDVDTLIDALIDIRDRLEPGPNSDRIGAALRSLDVETVDPVGQRFSSAIHSAQIPPTSTSNMSLDGLIAGVVSYGYTRAGVVRRHPVVVVYRYDSGLR